jgi:hypothetical protein
MRRFLTDSLAHGLDGNAPFGQGANILLCKTIHRDDARSSLGATKKGGKLALHRPGSHQ